MSLLNKDYISSQYSDLKQQLKIEIKKQLQILEKENLRNLQKIGYVRPKTRLQLMYADDYMTEKQFANILGLGQIIRKNPDLSDEFLYNFIVHHKVSLIYLNHVLKVVPDAITIIRTRCENEVVLKYVRTLEQLRQKGKRRKL